MDLTKKERAMTMHGVLTTLGYVYLGYVAVHHIGWLDGMAALVAFNTLVGAVRTKTSWQDLYPES